MYETEMNQLASDVCKTLGRRFTPAQKSRISLAIVRHLLKHFENEISITWGIEDVISMCEADGLKITDEQAREVLAVVLRNRDASIGVTWDTLRFWRDELYPELPKDETS
jgi:hypothetical protein